MYLLFLDSYNYLTQIEKNDILTKDPSLAALWTTKDLNLTAYNEHR